MIPSLIAALLLSQTIPEARGAILALTKAGEQIATRTVTYPAGEHMACVAPETTIPANSVTIRVGVLLMTPEVQTALGAVPLKGQDGKDLPWVYGALEVQAPPSAGELPPLPPWIRILETDEVEKRVSPVWPQCEIAIVREGFSPMPWTAACSTGANCTWTPPLQGGGFGAAVAAPMNLTLPRGTWSGSGCVRKPAVEWAGANSMPAVCGGP